MVFYHSTRYTIMMSVYTQTILSQFSIVLFIIITSILHDSHINMVILRMDMDVRFDINSTEIIVILFLITIYMI